MQAANLGRGFGRRGCPEAVRGDPGGGVPRRAGRGDDDVDERAGEGQHADGGAAGRLVEQGERGRESGAGGRAHAGVQRRVRQGRGRNRRGCRRPGWYPQEGRAQDLGPVRADPAPGHEGGGGSAEGVHGGSVRPIRQQEVRGGRHLVAKSVKTVTPTVHNSHQEYFSRAHSFIS